MSQRFLSSLIHKLDEYEFPYIDYQSFHIHANYLKDEKVTFQEGLLKNQPIFIKFIKYSQHSKSFIQQEITNLMNFQSHENIVCFRGITSFTSLKQDEDEISLSENEKRNQEEDMWIGIVLEKAPHGSISHFLQMNPQTSFERRLKWCIQICQVMKHLHDRNYIHRDIKPDNILLFENDQIKSCDFELTQKLLDELATTTYKGTILFSAPETFRNNDNDRRHGQHTFGSDIYSLGITLANILTGCLPNIIGSKSNFIKQSIQMNILECYQKELSAVLLACIEDSPTKRLSISEIVSKLSFFEKKERLRLFEEQSTLRNQNEIDLFSYIVQNNLFLVFNFFDISFDPQQRSVEFLEYASELGDIKIVDYYMNHPLIQKQMINQTNELNEKIMNSYEMALEKKNYDLVNYWKQSNIWDYLTEETIYEIFTLSVDEGDMDMIQFFFSIPKLLQAIINNKDEVDFLGDTVLIRACEKNQLSMIQFFMENEHCCFDNIYDQNYDGFNILMTACGKGYLDIVQYLMEQAMFSYEHIYDQNDDENNALMLACEKGHYEILEYLFRNMPTNSFTQLQDQNKNGQNILIIACYNGHLQIVQYLLENHFFPLEHISDNDNNETNILMLSCYHLEIIQYLFEHYLYYVQPIIFERNNFGFNLFLISCFNGQLNTLQYLLENTYCSFTNIEDTDIYQNNALLIACSNGHIQVMQYLIENQICPFKKIHDKNNLGNNALMIGCINGNLEIVRYLLENTILPFINIYDINNNRETALQLAIRHKHQHILHYFQERNIELLS